MSYYGRRRYNTAGSDIGLAACVVGAVAVAVVAFVAITEEVEQQQIMDAQWAGLCANESGDRVDDDQCGDWDEHGSPVGPVTPGNYFMWIDTSTYTGRMPGVGQRVTVGQRVLPSGSIAAKGIPKAGGDIGTIKRGGFGVGAGKAGGSGS